MRGARRASWRRPLGLVALALLAAFAVVTVAFARPRRRPAARAAGPVDAAAPAPAPAVDAGAADARSPADARAPLDAGLLPPRDAALPIYDAGRSARPRLDGGLTGPRPTPADAGTAVPPRRAVDAAPDLDLDPRRPR